MQARETALSKVLELTYELKVEEAMTTDVITVSSRGSMADLRPIFRDRGISGTPVVDDGQLVGIVSLEDFIESLVEHRPDARVGDRMTRALQTVYADEPLVSAIDKFSRYRFGRFPVVDRTGGALVGILTKGDVIRCVLRRMEASFHEKDAPSAGGDPARRLIEADRAVFELTWNIAGGCFPTAGRCASELKQNLLHLGFDPAIARRIGVATFEAEMNLVIFTSGGTIVSVIDPDSIRVTVSDRGPGIADVEQAMRPGYSTAPDWVRELGFGAGMGLPNIKLNTDRFTITSEVGEGTALEFVVYRHGHP